MPITSHDLLFGALALQTGHVTRPELVAILFEHGPLADGSLGRVLCERGMLRQAELTLLEALVESHLRRHDNDLDRCLAVLPAGVELQQLARTATQNVDATLDTQNIHPPAPSTAPPGSGTLADSSLSSGPGVPLGTPSVAGGAGRFRILRSHARGGLGEVFVAQDEELQREVALKQIQTRHASHAESRQRFLLEAEVTGRLEHPGIVPVYGLGCSPDGRPYYAMRFIKGDSLQEAIQHFHTADATGRKPGERAIELRKLLGRFLAVCDAISYAHSRGVLHRDLKPANIMLGPFGETLVVDWGLAKSVGQAELPGNPSEATLPMAGNSAATQDGSVLGTPAYMSPEQAAGELLKMGPSSDVYSLGATLYCLLTGKAPFQDANIARVLEQVREGQFPAPRTVHSGVPAPLDAICLKAMAQRPEDRYPSASALSDDLEHWLADEPVAAYPEPWWRRAARWRRRHQALVSTATALCLTAALALGVSNALLVREQDRTRRAETDRVRAQVDSLLDANPRAVPALLTALEPYRDQATAQLRALAAQTGLEERKRLRAHLALLRSDATQVSFLRERLPDPQLGPEEMLLLCEELMPHRSALTADLWAEVDRADVPVRRRFRCLVALAQFDPDNPRWPAVAPRVVEALLNSDPLHLGAWMDALRPVRGTLMSPLGRVFRDPERLAERQVAANILDDYAADRLDLLVDLLVDADERQFVLLLPRLEKQRAAAVVLLRRGLAHTPSPVWNDDAPGEWPPVDAALQRELEDANGMAAPHFALCQTLPLGRFAAVATVLSRSGFRPVRLRPYVSGTETRAAVVWVRDGRSWRMVQGVSAQEVHAQDENHRRSGYQPADVAGYRAPTEQYAALWVRTDDPASATRLLIGIPEPRRQAVIEPLQTEGYLPRTYQLLSLPGGLPSYSAVWGLSASSFDFSEAAAVRATNYAEQLTADRLLLDVSLTADNAEPRYTALWQQGGTRTAAEVHGLSPSAHLVRCRDLAAQGYRPASLAALTVEGSTFTASVWHRPVVTETVLETLAKRQANAAAALLRLGESEAAWPLLRHGPDPRRRTYLLHRLGPLGVDAKLVADRLEVEPDASARRALILSLGRYGPEQLPVGLRERLLPRLRDWYRDDPDAGVHGAIGWLLGHGTEGPELRRIDWGQTDALHALDKTLIGRPAAGRRWYVNSEGQTLTIVPEPVEFWMGSPYQAPQRRSNETRHLRRIGRAFALATTTVTAEQYQHFLRDHPEVHHKHPREYSPDPDGPAMALNWYQAAQYCRWLSEKEGMKEEQMCYPSVAEIEKSKDGRLPLKLPADALKRTGYRLPTEAEWEYACRAEAETTRFFGHAEEMLGAYAWYAPNSRDRTWPGGRKMPNDLGLFDMHGNIWQWCHNEYAPYPPGRTGRPALDEAGGDMVLGEGDRPLRGGTFFLHGSSLRSAFRLYDRPTYPFLTFGFRIARTQP